MYEEQEQLKGTSCTAPDTVPVPHIYIYIYIDILANVIFSLFL